MKSTLTGGKPATLGNSSPVKSPTDKGFDPKYSAHTPVAGENLALGWLLDPDPSKGKSLCEKVLARLIQSEAHAERPFKVDYRIAQVIVIAADREQADPIRYAWQSVLHCRPEEVWPNIVNNRKLKLGAEYSDWYDEDGNLKPDLRILARREALLGNASMREPEAGETRNALGPDTVSPVLQSLDIPQTNRQPMAESRGGDAPQKTCAYGAQEAKLAGQKRSDLTGTSCSTETKREARRALTSEFGLDAPPAGVAAPADKKPVRSVRHDRKRRDA